ncbi:MAG: aldose 1-epimerase family protein [Promethearchaeota archaeon]
MVKYMGNEYRKEQFLKLVGDVSQVAEARPSILTNGKANGVKCVDFTTGSGLTFTVLPGRALDIAQMRYNDVAISWISKNGIVSPRYYEEPGINWLRTYFGGLLTTCGLTYSGAPCNDNGQELGLHGRISNTEAENICVENYWEDHDFVMKVSGEMRETRVFGENIRMKRTISTTLGSNVVKLHDDIENLGYEEQPLMIIYHCNFGFPLIVPGTTIHAPFKKTEPRDDVAKAGLEDFHIAGPPRLQYKEQVFLHELNGDDKGNTLIVLENPFIDKGFGFCIRYNTSQLPFLTQWKQMGISDYVLGIEPCTAYPLGRPEIRKRGELMMIEPGKVHSFDLSFEVLPDKRILQERLEEVKKLTT